MAALSRYKKPGGFLQLLTLLEGLSPQKRNQLLQLIQQEDEAWHLSLKKKSLSFDRVLKWPDVTLKEILNRLHPRTLGVACSGLESPMRERVLYLLSGLHRREVEGVMNYSQAPLKGEILATHSKVVGEVRAMISEGILRLEEFAPEFIVPAHIEETLKAGPLEESLSADSNVVQLRTFREDEPHESGAPDWLPPEDHSELLSYTRDLWEKNRGLLKENRDLKSRLDKIQKRTKLSA